jgi:tyrosine-protein kinase Etk/Wzc
MEENKTAGLYNVQQENETEKSSFDIRTLYTMVVLNWKWFVLSLIVCLSLAMVYLKLATPIYQANVKLLIKDDQNNSNRGYAGKSQLLASSTLGIMTNSAGIDNEMVILGSSNLASETVKDLKLYVNYWISGRIKDHIIYCTQPVNVDLDANSLENLKMPIKLNIKLEKGQYHITGTYVYVPNDPDKLPIKHKIDRTTARLPFSINTSVGIISFNANPGYQMPEDRSLKAVIVSPKMAGKIYAKSMAVSQTSKTTTIAELVLKDAVPMRAVDYLRQLSVCYNRQANEDKNEIAMRTEQFINSRLEKINNELGATEGDLESTKRRYNIIDPKINSAQTIASSDVYTQKLAETNMQIELLRSIDDYMNEPVNKYQTLPTNVGLTDPTASALINKYNDIAIERNRLLRSASENSPAVTPLTAQLDDLISSLRLNLFACNSHIANDRQIGKCLYIVVSLNLITEEVDEEQHTYRQGKSKNKCHKQDDRGLWACLAHNQWIVYKLALVCCSCQRYRVLLALLQQHKVQTRLNLLLTSNLCKHALLLWTR